MHTNLCFKNILTSTVSRINGLLKKRQDHSYRSYESMTQSEACLESCQMFTGVAEVLALLLHS